MSGSRLAGVRRFAVRTARRALPRRSRVCFLVAGGDAADLDASVHALRALRRSDVRIVVATAADGPGAVAGRAHARADWRVRHLAVRSWAQAAAAATRTRSRYVVALPGGDLPDLAALDRSLAAVGRREPGLGVGAGLHLADPAAAVFARRTWRRVADTGSAGAALVTALAAAPDAVRLETRPTHTPASSIRGMTDTRAALVPWLALQDLAGAVLDPLSPLRPAWATSTLAGEAQRYLEDVERYDDDQWTAFQTRIAALAEAAGDDGLDRLPVEARVRVALAAGDRRADLVRFVADRRFDAGQYPTTAADGAAYAVLPVPADLPPVLLRLNAAETALRTSVRRLCWVRDGLELELFACVAGVDLRQHRPDVAVRLVDGDRVVPLDTRLGSDREVTRWMASHHVDHDLGVLHVKIPLDDLALPVRQRLEVTVAVAGLTRTARVTDHDPSGSAALLPPRRHAGLTIAAELTPELALVATASADAAEPAPAPAVTLDDVEVTTEALTVRGRGLDGLLLRGPQGPQEPELSEDAATWSLRHDPWGFGSRPVPPGRYLLIDRAGAGVGLSEDLGARLPEVVLTDAHRVVLRREPRAAGHALVLALGPPLADDEVGPFCQRRLQEWYADPAHELDPDAVYLQAYTGQNATDSPLAIAEELAHTRPDLHLTWAVADRAARVPPGSETVLWRSRAWYAALARSRYVVTNIEMESWFRRRPGQEVLQTFHGYPSKAMGLGLWRQKNFTETRIEQQLDRTARNWTLLLTPTPEMDVHYRDNYRYDGPILAAGYPRDDSLLGPEAGSTRAAVRARLGIADDVVAVLYAPTWRDDQALDFRSARMVDHLDVEAAADALGPGYVLLLRGHRFMAAAGPRDGARSRVLDVTSYPEINDLLLAADVAVLDYSSIRFDFALTGRPMVFLVPDLEDYATTKRGFLYDFAPTAPGPHARSSAEVIAALRDLDGVATRHRADYERFNATYNRFQDGQAARRTVARFFRPDSLLAE